MLFWLGCIATHMLYIYTSTIQFACHHLAARHNPPLPRVPFSLIQGPPGTGKTHTVRGILNVWHLVYYQRAFDMMAKSIEQALRAMASRGAPLPSTGEDILTITAKA